jgi:hypothetical protein
MEDLNVKFSLFLMNYALGIAIVGFTIYGLSTKETKIPLYITAAIITAGPLESILCYIVKRSDKIPPYKKEDYLILIDYITSLVFMVFLLLVVIEST